jgi:hypothetical protein
VARMSVTAEKWAKRVAEWRESGLTSVRFCEGRGYSPGGLRHWAYRLAHGDGKMPKALKKPKAPKTSIRMARVLRAPRSVALAVAGRAAGSAVDASVSLVEAALAIELGTARVLVRRGVDAVTLATVVDVLAPRVGAR